jgi:hypothetical protein
LGLCAKECLMPTHQFPRRTVSEPFTVNVNDLPSWVPAAGKFANLGQTNTVGSINPDPAGTQIYSQYNAGGGYNLRFDFWCSGVYVPTLGAYGSFVQAAGGNNAYDGNDIIQLDIAARTWLLMNNRTPYLATSWFDNGFPDGATGGAVNSAVSTDGAWIGSATANEPQGQPYVPHTYGAVEFLPADADGSSLGSFCFLNHSQNSVNIQGVHLWKRDVATGLWARRTVRASNSYVNRVGCCYDSLRKGLWFVANKNSDAYQPLGLFFYSWLTDTVTELTLSGSSGWQSLADAWPALTYVASKDCIVMPMVASGTNNRGAMVCFNLASVPLVPSGTVPHHAISYTGTPCPGVWKGNYYGVTAAQARIEYCSLDGNLYVPDAYANLGAGSARLYKLTPPAGAVTGTWAWGTPETLTGKVGTEILAVRHVSDATVADGKGIMGNFRYVPALKSFILYDGRSSAGNFQSSWPDAQLLRPAAFT